MANVYLCIYDAQISGATVFMLCRNKERGEAALSKIQSATGNTNVHLEVSALFRFKNVSLLANFLLLHGYFRGFYVCNHVR